MGLRIWVSSHVGLRTPQVGGLCMATGEDTQASLGTCQVAETWLWSFCSRQQIIVVRAFDLEPCRKGRMSSLNPGSFQASSWAEVRS